MPNLVQWWTIENQQSPVYVVNKLFNTKLCTLKVLFCYFFKFIAKRYNLGLSNELLFIITAQRAAKL